MAMRLYGAEPIELTRFRGVCFDQSATELDQSLVADCQDVIFEGDYVRARNGRSLYNTTSPTNSKVRALGAYYPSSGSRKILIQAGTVWYADYDASVDFDKSLATGLTAGVYSDLFQWRDWMYLGNSVDGLYKWTGGVTAASAVAMLTAPSLIPVLQLSQTVIHTFDANTGGGDAWDISSGSALTRANNTAKRIEGTACLQLTATSASAEGINITKAWDGGAGPYDLSGATELWVSVMSQQINNSFIIAISDNSGNFDWELFPTYTITTRDAWQTVKVPLSGIPPESRTACTKIGIQWVNAPGYGANRVVYFDRAVARGPLSTGDYKYFVTYANVDSDGTVLEESNPGTSISSATTPQITIPSPDEDTLPALGINVVVPTTTSSSVDSIRVYRYLKSGNFRWPRLIKTLALTTDWTGASTTLAEDVSIAETADIEVAATTGFSVNDYVIVSGTEVMKITAINSGPTRISVTKAQYGTADQAHSNGANVTKAVVFTDSKDDGSIAVENTDVLATDNRINPPLAETWAIVNGRVLAGNPTISSTNYPQRVYLTEFDFPERFASAQIPDYPNSAGWFELAGGDRIVRIIEYDGMAVIFTDRSVWSLDGTGWDDYTLRQRCYVGLDARSAVVKHGRLIYFLSQDGIRVVAPNHVNDGVWETWVISEPVESKLLAIPADKRNLCAMGLDEKDRVVTSIVRAAQTLPDRELVFDPKEDGALNPGLNRQRPGWTFHTRGHSVYYRLKRASPDYGQLLGGDNSAAFVYYLNKSSTDTALYADTTGSHASSSSDANISWNLTGNALDAGACGKAQFVYVDVLADASIGSTTTLNGAINDSTTSVVVTSAASFYIGGYVQVDSEVMEISNISGSTLTVTRAVAGTVAASHSNGATATPVSVMTVTPVLDGSASSATQLVSLGTASSGIVEAHKRLAASNAARYIQVKISGTHRVAETIRAIRVGVLLR